ncbi:hypothetical protein CN204_04255 [Sinorhizobium meliloti]|uniref:portal protein n=1 Tax=Rhizobium meliloti TaxID=382 RepID=UPI000FDACC17|nr:hypothetical protein [Sinorhizobium meliloti]RVH87750.1 hypothetical protein CN204_04255 [Sinorhizobium meliloti]
MAKKQLSDDEIRTIVEREIRLANGSDRSELSKKRTRALEYFNGEMLDTPPEAGRSSVVSLDLADTMGWMLPGILRVFTASDKTAEAEPVGPEDIQSAKQATDALNYVFWKKNDGYRILYNATHDGLMTGNGIVKAWWDASEKSEVTTHTGLSVDQLAALIQDEGVEVQTHTENEDGTHDIKISRVKSYGCVKVDVIPGEDFYIDPDATTIDDARFLAHRKQLTRSDLVEMGFERSKVESLSLSSEMLEPEQASRGDNTMDGKTSAADNATELVDLYECQFKVDVDGDGLAETVHAYYGGNKDGGVLLDWEVWEDEPIFYDIPCDPVPHRWDARSIADQTMDVQRVKTVLLRQALDNIYATNLPQKEVDDGAVLNPDELTNPTFGGIILKKPGSQPIIPHATPFVANYAFEAIAYQDEVITRRTGVSRQTMALDPDALQNQTATANQNAQDAAYSKIELIARNMAELGWRKVFRGILRLLIKHQDRPMMVRMTGDEWVEVDPRPWNADMGVTINVGLGTGSRDRDMAMLNGVLANQMGLMDRYAGAGMTRKAVELLPFVHNTLMKIAESAGLKSPEQFYPPINKEDVEGAIQQAEQAAGQPPPELQMQMAIEDKKIQASQQKEAAQMQADVQVKQAELEKNGMLEAQKLQYDYTKFEKQQQLEREKMAQQRELELIKMGLQEKPEGGGVVSREDERANTVSQSMERMMQAISALMESNGRAKTITGPNGKTYTVQVN